MITAKEAKELSNMICKEAKRDLEDLDAEIRLHASKGERRFWHDGYVHKQAIEVLGKLGYRVTVSDSQIDGPSLQVIW